VVPKEARPEKYASATDAKDANPRVCLLLVTSNAGTLLTDGPIAHGGGNY